MLERDQARKPWIVAGIALVLALSLLFAAIALALVERGPAWSAASDPVQSTDRAVPTAIADIPLADQNGRPTDLASLHGRIVVLADFMTSCQEECPITSGALMDMERTFTADHLLGRVTIVEASVDPWRDTPGRLLAYQKKFGVDLMMMTGSAADLHRLWSWFGVWYERVPEGSPAAIDWQDGQPYTFDIQHSDAVFVLNQEGNERAVVTGGANVGGKLSKSLSSLLDQQGRHELVRPGLGSWTPGEMLSAVSSVLGQPIPQPSSG